MVRRKPRRRLRRSIKEFLLVTGCGMILSTTLALFTLNVSSDSDKYDYIMPGMIEYEEVQKMKEEAEIVDDDNIVKLAVVEGQEKTIEEKIQEACEEYKIPYELPLAIARLETGWFKSSAYLEGNNPGGMSINEVPIAYETIDDGVNAFVSNLAENYFALGLDTPEEIGGKYCPINPEWGNTVKQLMEMGV